MISQAKPIPSLVCALALSCVATFGVHAQEQKSFVGPAIGLTVASVQTTLTASGNPQDLGEKSATSLGLSGSWGFALGKDWVLTGELSYNPDTVDLASQTYSDTSVTPAQNQKLSLKARNDLGLGLSAGYRLGSKQLVYGRISYHSLDVEASSSGYAASQKQSIEVPGVGIGYAYTLTPQFELRGEYEWLMYAHNGINNASQDVLRLGLNYRF